jgi:hypothetical protein
MNDQRSLEDQLKALGKLAIDAKLYDADDFLVILRREVAALREQLAEISELVGPGGDGTPFGRVESMLCTLSSSLADETARADENFKSYERVKELYLQAEDVLMLAREWATFSGGGVHPSELLAVLKGQKPHGGWAPGNYQNKCCLCGEMFIGDKRAVACLKCAAEPPKREG